jgi:hypothetical protein
MSEKNDLATRSAQAIDIEPEKVFEVVQHCDCADRLGGIKDRCKAELNLLTRIEKASMESRERCELVWRILSDNSIDAIDEILKKKALERSL